MVLNRIAALLSEMPNAAGETKRRRELRDIFERGEREVPVGVVLIVASDECEFGCTVVDPTS